MNGSRWSRCGYSLIELLVVLVILGVLSIVAVARIGNRSSVAVRSVMDELEGTLTSAHKLTVATGQDVVIGTQGNWDPGGIPLAMAYRAGTSALTSANITTAMSQPETFQVALISGGNGLAREHMHAGIVASSGLGSEWWTLAMHSIEGKTNTDITTVAPFCGSASEGPVSGFQNVLTSSPNLFQGASTIGTARISGASKRFNSSFWIQVVGISNGLAIPGGPMGLLVVQANGATVYKFYNPGVQNGDGQWRRI